MAKSLKFQIIAKWPDVRGIDVHYYTQPLYDAIQETWAKEGALFRTMYPQASEAEVQDYLVRRWPAGKILHLIVPLNSTPETLVAYILDRSPYEDVMIREQCLLSPPDMSAVDQVMTSGGEGVPERILLEENIEPPVPIL